MGGATLDDPFKEGEAMKINGSALVISADTKEDAMKLVESDIYYKSGVWDPKKVCYAKIPVIRHDREAVAQLSCHRFKYILSRLLCAMVCKLCLSKIHEKFECMRS